MNNESSNIGVSSVPPTTNIPRPIGGQQHGTQRGQQHGTPRGQQHGTPRSPQHGTPRSPQHGTSRGRSKPMHNFAAAGSNQTLETELFRILSAVTDPSQARQMFRVAAMSAANAVGVCHFLKSGEAWTTSAGLSTGRTPPADLLDADFNGQCEEATSGSQNRKPVLLSLESLDGLPGVLMPVAHSSDEREVLLLVLSNANDAARGLRVADRVASAIQIWLSANHQSQSRWKLESLASIMELVAKIESSVDIEDASATIVNEMVKYVGCSNAAVAVRTGDRLILKAISGVNQPDTTSLIGQSYLNALCESEVRARQGVYPPIAEDNAHLLLAHKQLVAAVHNEAALSAPLSDADGNPIAAWTFTGESALLQSEILNQFLDAAAPHVASALAVLKRAEQSSLQKKWRKLKTTMSSRTRSIICASLVGLCLLMLVPVKYRVRCSCVTEPAQRRFAVAPFEGTIKRGYVDPGDVVTAGQVLAEMDGRQTRLKLSSVSAERHQAVRQRDIELSEGNIPKTFLSELEGERLSSEEAVLQYQQANLRIRSPIAGVVLDGSLERAEAASVTTGEVLFEVGMTDRMKVEIAIPSNDIAQVTAGNSATIWMEGREDTPLRLEIQKIHPRSQIRDARNVFIAEIDFENSDDRFRPGMKGAVRIDGDRRTLGWTLFHKPVNYIKSRLTWW